MDSTISTLKRKRSLSEDDLSCSVADPKEKVPTNQSSQSDVCTNSCTKIFDRSALPNTEILRKVQENASNTKHISSLIELRSEAGDDAENNSPVRNTRFQSWVNERKDRGRIRNVEQATWYYLERL